MNDSNFALNTISKLKEEIILYEESFLSRLYTNKSELLTVTNLYNSSCEEPDGKIMKEEKDKISTNLENHLAENSIRKTSKSIKRVAFDMDSHQIIEKDIRDVETTSTSKNRILQFKKFESKSKLMKVFSKSIDDKFKKKASTSNKKSVSEKFSKNTKEKKNEYLIFPKNEKYLERISSEGLSGRFSNTGILKSIRSYSSKFSGGKNDFKNKMKTLATKNHNLTVGLDSSNSIPNHNNSFVNHIKTKLKKLLDKDYNNKFETFNLCLKNLDEKKDNIVKEKSHEIIKFIHTLHEEKLKNILEIHKKYDEDLNKLENMLDPSDVNNISNKIYRFVYADKQEELRNIELEFSEKKLKRLEEIETYYENITENIYEKKFKKIREFKKEFSEDLIVKIANFWGKKDNTNTLTRTTNSVGNFSSNNNLSFEN